MEVTIIKKKVTLKKCKEEKKPVYQTASTQLTANDSYVLIGQTVGGLQVIVTPQ